MISGAQKRKKKHSSNFKVLLQSPEGRRNYFAASITPTKSNLAEKACNALLEIIQLQRQSFSHVLTWEISNAINAAEMFYASNCVI